VKAALEIFIAPLLALLLFTALPVLAQQTQADDPGQQKPTKEQKGDSPVKPVKDDKDDKADKSEHADHEGMDHSEASADHSGHMTMGGHQMMIMATVTGGPFRAMQAIGSGTSLQPASTNVPMWHFMPGGWSIMLHMDLKVGYSNQGRPRGIQKAESENWFMGMAEHKLGPGQLMLRAMVSAEPLTAPHGGFPLLFQTGETYRKQGIIDAQHPHDVFMELAAMYTIPLSERVSVQFYGGPVGEPALGPTAFMHRASASENPAAPISHHWQDATHITHGVVTAGVTAGLFKFEGSLFHGAEPDEDRLGIDLGKLDSYSFRAWFTPTPNWAIQFSFGHLVHPEELYNLNFERKTASIAYNRPFRRGSWASTLIWGRDHDSFGNTNSYLFESTLNFIEKNHLYTRLELVDKTALLAENIWGRPGVAGCQLLPAGAAPPPPPPIPFFLKGLPVEKHHLPPPPPGNNDPCPAILNRAFRVGEFTFGGVRDVVSTRAIRFGIGTDMTLYHKPRELDPIYGQSPVSFRVFLRFRPGDMQ
jgi:hypothetical protein